MNKKIIGLIGGCVLIAGLAAAVVVVSRQQAAEEESSLAASESLAAETSQDPAALALSAQDPDSVVSVAVTNSTGTYEIIRTAEADAEAATDAVFGVKGWEDVPTNTSLAWTLANNTATLTASSVVAEDCTEMEKYGLGDDAAAAVMTFDDGSTFAFRVGSFVSDGENNYFAVEGEDTVYAVKTSLVANFSKAAEDFLSMTLLEAPAQDAYPIVNSLTVSRTDLDEDIVLTYAEDANNENTGGTAASHEMTSPIPAYLSVERSTDVITGIFGVTADHILKIYPEETDFAEYGLDTPFGTAVMDCDDGNVYTLNIGDRFTETDEETGAAAAYYPVYLEGVDVIYAMAEADCLWASVTPTDLASSLVLATYVWDIEEMNITAKGKESMEFDITGEDKETAVVKLNGKTCDTERYRLFYTFLLQTTAESVVLDGEPAGEPEITLYFRTHDGSKEQELCFYRQDAFNCLITVNGESAFGCRASYIDTFLENMDLFDTDEDFIKTWS
ncbi:MAG: DUF4340 domain-containing protein [Ruminococcus sp.]|nr:DUF4340 domain-containing protein [Ruminococcus sp.]